MSKVGAKYEKTIRAAWNKPTNRAYLQIFGNGSGDTCPSVYLFADSQRYVFNCGEATQRLFHENKLKLGKINHLFFTQISWKFIGGLPGLLLTLRDSGKTAVNIHSPSNLSEFFRSSRCFLSSQHVDINCVHYMGEEKEKFADENIIVWPICVKGEESPNFSYNSEITEIKESKDNQANHRESLTKNNKQSSHDNPSLYPRNENHKRCKLDISPKHAVSYICQLVPMPGKMNMVKARALGVPKGPLLGQLQKGHTVTLENGSVVQPEDVMEMPEEGCIFGIIDCPSQSYFKNLVNNKQLASMYEEGGSQTQPSIIVHLSPADIVETLEYSEWTKRFGSSCQHLFLNSKMCPPKMAMLSQLGIQYNLYQLNPDIFPRLYASDTPEIEIKGSGKENWRAGDNFLIFHLRPTQKIGYDTSDIEVKWNAMAEKVQERWTVSVTEKPSLEEIKDSLTDFIDPKKFSVKNCDIISNVESVCNNDFKDMDKNFEIVFLGTGASLPSKYRNVSSTLVRISEDKLMLLDCGEGTYGQLYRHYGADLDKILSKLCCVFISHIHADHHLGLIRILQAQQKSSCFLLDKDKPDPVLVVGPPSLLSWLRSYGTFYETLHLRFLDSSKFQQDSGNCYETLSLVLESKVSIVAVDHCYNAFGLVLTHRKGWKLVYSGDTRPCENLIKEGLGATVLIHEATFENDLHAEALLKLHSTATEAIKCGQDMKTKFILLNHFSQRYPKIPVFNEKFNDCTGIAFDHMTVNFQNISSLPKLLEPLQKIFIGEIQEQSMLVNQIKQKPVMQVRDILPRSYKILSRSCPVN